MANGKSLEEWIAEYDKRTPDKFVRDERYELFYLPEKGFCEVGETKDMVIIHQLAGDGRFWKSKVSDMARAIGKKMCGTWCIRDNIKAYARLFGFRIVQEEETPAGENGISLKRYHGIDANGKRGLASPAFRYETGEQAYMITWEP